MFWDEIGRDVKTASGFFMSHIYFSSHICCLAASGSARMIASRIWVWAKIGAKLLCFAVLGVGVLPIMIGLFFEHVVLPLRFGFLLPSTFISSLEGWTWLHRVTQCFVGMCCIRNQHHMARWWFGIFLANFLTLKHVISPKQYLSQGHFEGNC